MELKQFIRKRNRDIEKEFGFDYYLELKDRFQLSKNQNHKNIVDAFFRFVGDQNLKVVKTDNGEVVDIFDMSSDEIKSNLIVLEGDKGRFFDEILEISYAFLGNNFFAYVQPNMVMFSASKEDTLKMAGILHKYGLKYHKPYSLNRKTEILKSLRKLGRNEPCHCGSGIKYKKCCLNKDIEETGKPKKVKATYY